jgi:hypothetical protein
LGFPGIGLNEEPIRVGSFKNEIEEDDYLLELAIFMASSTRDVVNFKHYGPYRLMQSLIRVLDLPSHIEHIKKDEFLEKIRRELDEFLEKRKDKEAFTRFLDQLIMRMLEEYRHRLNLK